MRKKVVVAMSGGVDSSTSAALLVKAGYEVIGITMHIWPRLQEAEEADGYRGCCSLAAVEDARRVASKLGISHYVLNFKQIFAEKVIADFCDEYRKGRTPNPCIRCNQYIKFDALLGKAGSFEADFVATGHYARIEYDGEQKRYLLRKGVDPLKDQSYALYTMTQEQLAHTLFPLGAYSKKQTRELARKFDLPVAAKGESQEICFIPDDDYARFLREYVPEAVVPGPIVDRQGRIVGRHQGILFYTVGQRKGLQIAAERPAGHRLRPRPMAGRPLYVISIDEPNNTLVVGEDKELYSRGLIASDVNWIAIEEISQPLGVKAKIRYKSPESEAVMKPLDSERVEVIFEEPQRAITPGQAVVFYQEDLVLGGGTIDRVLG